MCNYRDQTMINKTTIDKWVNFTTSDEFKSYFVSDEEKWDNTSKEVILFIRKYNKKPSTRHGDTDENRLGTWIYYNACKYRNNKKSDEIIINKWVKFITSDELKSYFE